MSTEGKCNARNDEHAFEISWLEVSIVITILALTFQLWPGFYFKTADVIYDSLDLTRWGWKSYVLVNVLVFIVLAVVRFRQTKQ